MKQTTLIAIVVICVVCAATMMVGCIGTHDVSDNSNVVSSVDSVFDGVTPSKNTIFVKPVNGDTDFEVKLYDDNTAKFAMVYDDKRYIMMIGTWKLKKDYQSWKQYEVNIEDGLISEEAHYRIALFCNGNIQGRAQVQQFDPDTDRVVGFFDGTWELEDSSSLSAPDIWSDELAAR